MMRIYGAPRTRSMRAVWAAEEAGATYEYVSIGDLHGGAARSPEYLALNPGGKVPTLVDGDLVLTESAAIVTYIGERHPEKGLVPPPRSVARAQYDRWSFFLLTELEQPLWTINKHSFLRPTATRVPAILPVAREEFREAERVLALGLGERPWLVGDDFTMVDILALHCLSWAKGADLPTEHDNLREYVRRLRQRPALARAREREDAA